MSKQSQLKNAGRATLDKILKSTGRVNKGCWKDKLLNNNPQLLDEYGEVLLVKALDVLFKELTRELQENRNDENPVVQLSLPGMVCTRCITVETTDGFESVAWEVATEEDLKNYAGTLDKNIHSATERRLDFGLKYDYLKPGFDAKPGCTVLEAAEYVKAVV